MRRERIAAEKKMRPCPFVGTRITPCTHEKKTMRFRHRRRRRRRRRCRSLDDERSEPT